MSKLTDILTFRCLVTPVLLQVLFWAGIAGNLYGSWWLYAHGNWAWIMSLVFGSLGIRVLFESLMVKFRSYVPGCWLSFSASLPLAFLLGFQALVDMRADLAAPSKIRPTDGD